MTFAPNAGLTMQSSNQTLFNQFKKLAYRKITTQWVFKHIGIFKSNITKIETNEYAKITDTKAGELQEKYLQSKGRYLEDNREAERLLRKDLLREDYPVKITTSRLLRKYYSVKISRLLRKDYSVKITPYRGCQKDREKRVKPTTKANPMPEHTLRQEVLGWSIVARLGHRHFADYQKRFGHEEQDLHCGRGRRRSKFHPSFYPSAKQHTEKLWCKKLRWLLTPGEVLGTLEGVRIFAEWAPATWLFKRVRGHGV